MSWRYRRRSYGGRRRSSGARVRRTLKIQQVTNGATITTSSVAIPVDSTKNVGINIHEVRLELHAEAALGPSEYYSAFLNRNTPTAERHISDIDCICKFHITCYGAVAAGAHLVDEVWEKKFYPPIPIFQDEIVAANVGSAGAAASVAYWEIAYSLAWMSLSQIVGVAKNIII